MVENPRFYSVRRDPKESYDRCGLGQQARDGVAFIGVGFAEVVAALDNPMSRELCGLWHVYPERLCPEAFDRGYVMFIPSGFNILKLASAWMDGVV